MTILALDTTSEFGSVAIREGHQTVSEITLYSREGFAHLIFGAIEQALQQAAVRLVEVDCFAAASGPGSFTGVRVGLSAVKGMAEALGKPAVGISNLKALGSFGNLARRAVALDARRGQIYGAVYDAGLEPIEPETVLKLEDWLEMLKGEEYEVISGLPQEAFAGTRLAAMPFRKAPTSLAAAVAACAERVTWQDPAALDANYVRRSDAELFWKEA